MTAKNAVRDRVKGLRMGAEDYIVKPFEVAELLARVEVVLRRYNKMMEEGARALGLRSLEIPLNEATIADYLSDGNPIICSMGPGDFTDNGHFIVLTDWEDGMVTINDPNSKENSSKQWAFADIKYQIKNLWVFKK